MSNADETKKMLVENGGVADSAKKLYDTANTDQIRIQLNTLGADNVELELATADNGTEPIVVRQYHYASGNNLFGIVNNSMDLLDSSGNTNVPGTLKAVNGFKWNNQSLDDRYIRRYRKDELTTEDLNNVNFPYPYEVPVKQASSVLGIPNINWVHLKYFRHEDTGNYKNWGAQLAIGLDAKNVIFFRTSNEDATWNPWVKIYHAGDQYKAGHGKMGGYTFVDDSSFDTGMFSDKDGDLYFMKNGRKRLPVFYEEGITFQVPEVKDNIKSGETISIIMGKLAKIYNELKSIAFTGNYNDLLNKPSSFAASTITQDSTHRFVTDAEKNNWNNKTNNIFVVQEFNVSKLINTTWQDLISLNQLKAGEGSYIIQMSCNNVDTGLVNNIYTGIFSCILSSNDNNSEEILLHYNGKSNNANRLYLRIQNKLNNQSPVLQIASNISLDKISIKIKIKKVI